MRVHSDLKLAFLSSHKVWNVGVFATKCMNSSPHTLTGAEMRDLISHAGQPGRQPKSAMKCSFPQTNRCTAVL